MPPAKSAAKKSKPTEELPKEIVPVETTTTVKKSRAKKETNSTETSASKKVEEVPTTSATTTTTTTTTNQPTTVQNVVVQADTETSITENFSEFIQKFQGMLSQFNSLKAELKTLERKTMRQVKVVQKMNNRKKRKGTIRLW